ncbi:hypothetical protein Trydic_g14778 [Trypoxylus dichotomus]
MWLAAVLSILTICYFIHWYKWKKRVLDPIEKLPGVRRIPLIGTDYIFIGVKKADLFDLLCHHMRVYGPAPFKSWHGNNPMLHLMKPEHLEIIMNSSVHITKSHQYDYLHPWLGQGLLTSAGNRWRLHRKLIIPTFHFKILENYLDIFVEKTHILLGLLDSKANGKHCDIYPDINHWTLDVICKTAMGVDVDAMSNNRNEYIEAIYEIANIFAWKITTPVPNFIFNLLPIGRRFWKDVEVLQGFSKKVISERRKILQMKSPDKNQENGNDDETVGLKRRLCFLDMLLEASEDGKIFTDVDIREEVDTFMFEGHDTTTASISWTLLLLGNYPEIQEKLFQEVKYVLREDPMPKSINTLNNLKYLDCVIKEALRMFPSVPFIFRTIDQEIQIDNYRIPKDTDVVLHIYGIHRCPQYYPNPNVFDPDRFLPENCVSRHPFAYIPFSAGPRNCIGQKFAMYEEKTVLAAIVNRYMVIATRKVEDIKVLPDLTLKPLGGVSVKLERRM